MFSKTQVTPGDVVGVKELRSAMGVSLDCFDGDTNLDELIRQNNNGHHPPTKSGTNHANIHLIQSNIKQNAMLGESGQMILAGHQFNQNTPQVIIGNTFTSSASYAMINTTGSNSQMLGTGGLQIVQAPLGLASPFKVMEHSKMQSGSIIIQQPF